MACCSACFISVNEDRMDGEILEMLHGLSQTHREDIEDGFKNNDIAMLLEIITSDGLDSFTKCGKHLLESIVMKRVNIHACKVCFLRQLNYETSMIIYETSIIIDEIQDADKFWWVAAGLSVMAYLMEKLEGVNSNRSEYVKVLQYMIGLLKYINLQDHNQKREMFNDVVGFIIKASVMFWVFSACIEAAYIHTLQLQLGCAYPDLSPNILLNTSQQEASAGGYAVGFEQAQDDVITLLDMDKSNCEPRKAVVIYGPGGIGKTTLATAVYNRLQLNKYQVSKVDIYNSSKSDLKLLQQQILRDLFNKNVVLGSCVEGQREISNAFREEGSYIGPVFIFIDNAERATDIANLLPVKLSSLPILSRILITTRSLHLTDILKNSDVGRHEYCLKHLRDEEAKNLLRKKALGSVDSSFNQDVAIDDLVKMSHGHPLALTMAASYLHQNGNHVLVCSEMVSFLKSPSERQTLIGSPITLILGQSSISRLIADFIYNKLQKPYKEAFIDIASFFNNWKRHIVAYIFKDIKLKVLEEAGLLTVSDDGKLNIHHVIRDWARTLARKQIITDVEALKSALQNKQVLRTVTGIWVPEDKCKIEIQAENLRLMHTSLRVMFLGKSINVVGECNSIFRNLRYLNINSESCSPMIINKLKRVAFFHGTLKDCPPDVTVPIDLTTLAKNLQLWKSLRILDLSGSTGFTGLPEGFSYPSSLTMLDLSKCPKLKDLSEGFGQLQNLYHLNLRGCSELTILPEEFGELCSLEMLYLTDCVKLVSLPYSFGKLKSLCHLELRGCSELISLPDSFGDLSSLEELDLTNCKKLANLPDNFEKLKSLCHFHLRGCSDVTELPPCFGNLTSLEALDFVDCVKLTSLPSGFENFVSLRHLDLEGCSNLSTLPDVLGHLKKLIMLKLCCSKVKELPQSMGGMSRLKRLTLTDCSGITELPGDFANLSSMEELVVNDCKNLKKLPGGMEKLTCLGVMRLYGCSSLFELPELIGNLNSLKELVLADCKSLEGLPASFPRLQSLRHLRLNGTSKLSTLNAIPTYLETLDMRYCSSLESLPQGFGGLSSLKLLLLDGCCNLSCLSEDFGMLKSLKYLSLAGCSGLRSLSVGFGNLNLLEAINASKCSALKTEEWDTLHKIKSLLFVDVRESAWKANDSDWFMCLKTDLEAMYQKNVFESQKSYVLALIMYDPRDQKFEVVLNKITASAFLKYLAFVERGTGGTLDDVIGTGTNWALKRMEIIAYSIWGLLKLRYQEAFTTFERLHTLIVKVSQNTEEINVEVIVPSVKNGKCDDVDLDALIDPNGGFKRIFSPFIPFIWRAHQGEFRLSKGSRS